MSTLKIWLESEMAFHQEIMLSVLMVLASFAFYLGLGTIFHYPFMWSLVADITPYSAMMMAKNALGEEALFRLIPCLILFAFIKSKKLAIIAFFLFSPLFAYLHIGYLSLVVLGPISVIFTLAYLKFGGTAGKHLRGFVFVGLIHTAANLSIHSCARFF